MRFDPTGLSLRFGSREELDRFHHDLSDLLRRVIVEGMTTRTAAVDGAMQAREEMRRYVTVTRALNALRQQLRGGAEIAAARRRAVVSLGALDADPAGLSWLGPLLGDDVALALAHHGDPARSGALAQGLRDALAGGASLRAVASLLTRGAVDAALVQMLLDEGVIVVSAHAPPVDHGLGAALLADALGAELLVIVTTAPCAQLDEGRPSQRALVRVTASAARAHLAEGQLAQGSMGSAVDAALRFAVQPGRRAILTDPPHLAAALAGEAGTTVVADDESA